MARGLAGALTVVQAPAGYGKTTAVADCVRGLERTVAWVSLRADADEPLTFLTLVAHALEVGWPGVGAAGLLELADQDAPAAVVAMANAAVGRDVVLVLDDLHLTPGVVPLIERWVDAVVPAIRILAITRVDPDLPLSRLRARGQLTEIRADQLRMSASEAGRFLDHTMGLDLDAPIRDALLLRTEGWPAGLQLAALSVRGQGDPGAWLGTLHRPVDEYLADEVIAALDPEARHTLLRLSVLDRLDAHVVGGLLGVSEPEELLVDLERGGLFLLPVGPGEWRFHDLFADALGRVARRILSDRERLALHRTVAGLLRERRPRVALDHALHAQDWDLAETLLPLVLPGLAVGEPGPDQGLLARLPDEVVRKRPRIALMNVWAAFFSGGDALKELDDVDAALDHQSDAHVELALTGLMGTSLLHMGEVARAVPLLEEARARAGEMPPEAQAFLGHFHACGRFVSGDTQGALDAYARLLATPPVRDDPMWDGFLTVGRSILTLHLGRPTETLARIGPLWGGIRDQLDQIPGPFLSAAVLWLETNLQQGNLEAVHEAAGRVVGRVVRSTQGYAAASRIGLVRAMRLAAPNNGRWAEEERRLDDLLRVAWPAAHLAHYRTLRTRLSLSPRLGPVSRDVARHWLEVPGNRDGRGPIWGHNPLATARSSSAWFVRSRAWLQVGQLDEAERSIAAHQQWGEVRLSVLDCVEAELLRAELMLRRNKVAEAEAAVDRAVGLASPECLVEPFVEVGGEVAELGLERAEGVLAGRLSAMLQTRGGGSLLTDRELEVLRVVAAGLTTKRASEMLEIRPSTVKKHLENAYAKLEVSRRTEAVQRARSLGLLA